MIRRIHGPAQVSNAAATKYTAPAGIRATIRHMHVSNPSGAVVKFTMSIGLDAAGVRIFDAYSIAAGDVLDHYGIYALEPGEVVQAFADTTNILTLTIDADLDAA